MKNIIGLGILLLPSLVLGNEGYNRVQALDDKVKNAILYRAIDAHEYTCESVAKNVSQGEDQNGDGYWTVLCEGGEAYSVRVSNDDTAAIRVAPCGEVPESRLACSEDTANLAAEQRN